MMILLAVPWLYIAICAGASSVLPPVDYKEISKVQSAPANQELKTEPKVQVPAQDSQAKPEGQL